MMLKGSAHRFVVCIVSLLAAVVLGYGGAAVPARASGGIPITSFVSYGGHDLVEDTNGKLHLAFVDSGHLKYYFSTNQGASWTDATPALSLPGDGKIAGPTLTVDASGAVFIFYFYASNNAWDYTLSSVSNVSGSWAAQILQANADYAGNGHDSDYGALNNGITTRLAFVDSANQVHLIGAHYGWYGYGGTVWEFVRSAGPSGTWNPKVVAYHAHNSSVDCGTTYHETAVMGPTDKITVFSHVPTSPTCPSPPGADTVFFFERASGVWPGVSGASTTAGNVAATFVTGLRLSYDGLGRLHSINEGSDGQTVLHRVDWGSAESAFTAPAGYRAGNTALLADAAGSLTLIYDLLETSTLKFGDLYKREKPAGGTWSEQIAVTSFGPGHEVIAPAFARRAVNAPSVSAAMVYADLTSRTPTWSGQLYFAGLTSSPPPNGVISGSVILQGREVSPPAEAYSITLEVKLFSGSSSTPGLVADVQTNQSAQFTLGDIAPGMYTVTVKNGHTLASTRHNIAVGSGTTDVAFCALLEGDADDNNAVSVADFSILASAYGKVAGQPGFDPRADFNESDQINLMDFSAVATNFGLSGDRICSEP